jgi:MFS family permease
MSTASDVSELTPIAAAGINSSSTIPTTASRNDAEKHMQAEEKVENLSSSDCNSSGNGIGDFKNELIVVLVLTLSLMAVGFNIGFTSSSIADLMSEGRLNANTANWFASLSLLGSVLGSGLGGVMADLWGRKLPFILETTIAAVGWWLIVADFHVSMLLLGRLLCGIQAGISSTVVSVYLVETMTEARRSSTVACGNFVIQAGELMAFVFRLFFSWRWLAIVAICLALLFAIAVTILLPESPRWYIRHGKWVFFTKMYTHHCVVYSFTMSVNIFTGNIN